MSWLRKIGRAVKKVAKNPIVKGAVSFVPGGSAILGAYGAISAVNDLTGGAIGNAIVGGGGGGVPSNMVPRASSLPMFSRAPGGTALTAPPMGSTSGPGILPRGVGGKLQMPWNDPAIPQYLKQFAIDDGYLKQVVRAPKGYVVLRDAEGRAFGVNKQIAQAFRLWKPKKKPPISVRDWESLKRANRTVNKLKRVVKMSKVVSMPTRRRAPSKACA